MMNCLRCDTPLDYQGIKQLSPTYPATFSLTTNNIGADLYRVAIYACAACGKLEFFLPDIQPPADLPVLDKETAPIPERTKLLKIIPAETTIEEVYETLGPPAFTTIFPNGRALCYHSTEKNAWQTILIDHDSNLVRMVSIYNDDHHFTFDGLEEAYGHAEIVAVINGNEHWIFEGAGVALIAEGRDETDIQYVQFFVWAVTLDTYLALDGYAAETFAQNSQG